MCHSCEVGEKLAHIWRTYLPSSYFHFIDVPHTVHKAAQEQFKEQLKDFKGTLESLRERRYLRRSSKRLQKLTIRSELW